MSSFTNGVAREIVEAGAGCGKTTSLVARYMAALGQHSDKALVQKYAPQEGELLPHAREVLALTFTKEAASQMQDRVIAALLHDGRSLEAQNVQEESQISTYHAFCLKLIQPHLETLGYLGSLLSPEIARQKRRENLLKAFAEFSEKNELRKYFKIEKIVELGIDLLFKNSQQDFVGEIKSTQNKISEDFQNFVMKHVTDAQTIQGSSLSDKEKGASFKKWAEALSSGDLPALTALRLSFSKHIKESFPEFVENAQDLKKFIQEGYLESISQSNFAQEIKAYELLWKFVDFSKSMTQKYLDFEAVENEILSLLRNPEFPALTPPPRVILVDEFQDTSPMQFEILEKVSGPESQWYFVGDPKQSIYAFRKSDVRLFYRMREELELVKKETNYRSSTSILKLVNCIQDRLFKPDSNENDPPPQTLQWPEEKEEGQVDLFFLEAKEDTLSKALYECKSQELKASNHTNEDSNTSTAVLFRSWRKLYTFAKLLKSEGIPYTISGSENPYDSLCNQMFCDFLELVENPESKTSKLTLSKWGIDPSNDIDSIVEKDIQCTTVVSDWQRLLEEFCLIFQIDRFEGSQQWICAIERWIKAQLQEDLSGTITPIQLSNFLRKNGNKLEAVNPYASPGESHSGITLLTLHGSKGLEFDHVILPELFERQNNRFDGSIESDDGSHAFSLDLFDDKGKKIRSLSFDIEKLNEKNKKFSEEKRLLYVALTRAKTSMSIYAHTPSDPKNKKDPNPFAVLGLEKVEAPYWHRYLFDLPSVEGTRVTQIETEESEDEKNEAAQLTWNLPALPTVLAQKQEFLRMGVSQYIGLETDKPKENPEELPPSVRAKAQNSIELGNQFHLVMEHFDFSSSQNIESQVEGVLQMVSPDTKNIISSALNSLLNNEALKDLFEDANNNPHKLQREFGLFVLSDNYRLTGFADLLWFKSNEELVIIDWKTGTSMNRLKSADRIEKYKTQLSLYAQPFQQSFSKVSLMVVGVELSKNPTTEVLMNDLSANG